MFRHLRTKLTVLYAALFGVTLLVIAAIVSVAVANNATSVVNNELQANRDVFNRLWSMRADQLHDSADVLARDFGFRTAIASRDNATITSALNNLRERLGLDHAFLVENDGNIVGLPTALPQRTSEAIWNALDNKGDAAGVLILNGAPYQAVAAPVRAPDTIGWVVFAAALNSAQMRSFEDLAPIDLRAQAFTREYQRPWVGHDLSDRADLPRFAQLLSRPSGQASQIDLTGGRAIAISVPLQSMTPEDHTASTALVLSYPLSRALAPYNLLLILIAVAGLAGLALVAFGSWALAKSITQPIMALDEAAHLLQQGQEAHVEVKTQDEIARLAGSFNTMASGIKDRERRIKQMALTDTDSRLRNRRAFEGGIRKLLREDRQIGIAAFSINRYGFVRDAIGHELAAELMRGLGERLCATLPYARVARVSETTIAAIFDFQTPDDLLKQVRAVQRELEAPIRLDGIAIDVMTTAGVVVAQSGRDAATLITHATIAVDQARQQGRKAALFDAEAYGDPRNNLALISELYAALRTGDAWMVYQPKYDIAEKRITGAEALMRWRHPQRGMISPDLFIGMAEETGHIRGLTDWVLRCAINDQKLMREAGRDLLVSINVSGRLLDDRAFAERAVQLIQPGSSRLCFEITETAAFGSSSGALASIKKWQEAGIEVSIDDYGSGLSSLSYLKALRAHELKIDKSFVLAVEESRRDALLIKSTIDLAHSLGMKVTAEGVETENALALLEAMGCDLAQGYLIGKPTPLADFIAASDPLRHPVAAAPEA